MFAENFRIKAYELSRIKNLSEFGLNLDECQILFSKDMKYGVIFTESNIAIVDMNKKCLISKFSNEKNSRISKVKITHRNNITYINKSSESSKLVISSIDFIGYFFEMNIPVDTLDYIYVEAAAEEDKEDYIFCLTAKGDLEFIFLKQTIEKKKVNVIRDSGNRLRQGFDVNYMDYIEETNNLIIILSNGTLLNYTVSLDPESDMYLNLKTINYEEIKHLDNLEDKAIFSKNVNNFDVTAFKITKFIFYVNDDLMMEGPKESKQSVFLVIGFTKNKCDTFLSFYEIQSNQLLFLNRIELKNKIILDSQIYQTQNIQLNNLVPDYFIIVCKTIGATQIEILASDFLQCFSRQGRRRPPMDVIKDNVNGDLNGKDIFTLINEIEENSNNVRKIGIMGVSVVHNPDYFSRTLATRVQESSNIQIGNIENISVSEVSNLNDYKYMNYCLNLIIRKLINYSNFDVFIVDSDVEQINCQPKIRKFVHQINDENFNDEVMKSALTSDVNKHLNFFDKFNNNESIYLFRSRVLKIISEDSSGIYKKFVPLTGLKEDNMEVDFYLLFLLFNNDLLPIKYYLSLRDNVSSKKFFVSNDKLFYTVYNIFYCYLRKLIQDNLTSSVCDYTFLSDDKLLKNLETINNLVKMSKKRIENPSERPFNTESVILSDNSILIQTVLFEVENVILMIKIIRSFVMKIMKDQSEENLGKIYAYITENMNKKKEDRKSTNNKYDLTYFELLMMNNYQEIYPQWRKLFLSFFINFSSKGTDEMSSAFLPAQQKEYAFEDVCYFSKLQIFFQYLYFVIDYTKALKQGLSHLGKDQYIIELASIDEILIKEFFSEMEEEFKEYYLLLINFYRLDSALLCRRSLQENSDQNININNLFKIDITIISNFLIKLNKSKLTKTKYFQENLNCLEINFNAKFISMLKIDNYTKEALTLSKNIINLLTEFEYFITQLSLLLEMGLINLAYQFVNNSFACLVCYSEDLGNESSDRSKNLLEAIIDSEEFNNMKQLYFYFYEFLIINNHISLLFTLPYNFIERYILKEFLTVRKEFEDLLLIYFIKLKKIKEAEDMFSDYQKSSSYTNETKAIYRNLLDTLKFLFGEGKSYFSKDEDASVFMSKNESTALSFNIVTAKERQVVENMQRISNFDIKNLNEVAMKILEDSFIDTYNIQLKQTNNSFLNDTIKTLISKKQETAKKTFGMFTEIKPARKLEFDFASERIESNLFLIFLEDNASKYKSFLNNSKSNVQNKNDNINQTPIKREGENIKSLIFNSETSYFK